MLAYTKTTLPNGLRVILAPFSHTRAVSVLVLVGTGSKYEEKRTNGISHFLEHMFFKGTKKRPDKKEIAELMDSVGAEFNAFTSYETTGYYVKVECSHVSLALDMVSDILLNSTFPAQEIEREQGVVVEEINMVADNPMRKIHDYWAELLYGDQPAGWAITGTKETVRALRREDLLSYFQKQYRSKNMVVCVAGNFSKDAVSREIKRRFAGTHKGAAQPKSDVREEQHAPQARVIANPAGGQTHVLLGARAFSMFDKRRYALAVLAAILGGGMSSRMFLAVREEKGLVYYIRTQPEMSLDSGFLVTAAGIDNSRMEEAIREIMNQYRKIKQRPVGAKELSKAKNFLRGHMAIELEESDEIALYLAGQEIMENTIRDPEEEIAHIQRVTARDVQRVAQDVLRRDTINLTVLGPEQNIDFAKIIERI